MVRQTRTYLMGAGAGAILIAVAIVAFVVLVSAQVFRDWPISSLGGNDEKTAVSESHQVASPTGSTGEASRQGSATADAQGGRPQRSANLDNGNQASSAARQPAVSDSNAPAIGETEAGPEAEISPTEPESAPSNPSGPSSGSSPGSTPAPSPNLGSSQGSSSSGSSGGGSQGGSNGGGAPTVPAVPSVPKPSEAVTGTVNGVVEGVDETATGGALKESGVTGTVEGVVNGVAGPESTVGKVADGAAEVVGGIVGGGR